jgi:hypothetical protein
MCSIGKFQKNIRFCQVKKRVLSVFYQKAEYLCCKTIVVKSSTTKYFLFVKTQKFNRENACGIEN